LQNFVILAKLENESNDYKRLDFKDSTKKELIKIFVELEQSFIPTDAENIISFKENPAYKLEEDQIFKINPFQIEDQLVNSALKTVILEPLKPQDYNKIKYFAIVNIRNSKVEKIFFVVFDKSKIIEPGKKFWLLFFRENTFTHFNSEAIAFPLRIDGLWKSNSLYFKNLRNIKRIFNSKIIEYYREATKEEIEKFKELFLYEDIPEDYLTLTNRKLIWFIINQNISYNIDHIKKIAKEKFGISLETSENGKFKLPKRKGDFSKFLRLLNDDLLESPLTQNKYEVNSKKKLRT
jgi:hypothetical protein